MNSLLNQSGKRKGEKMNYSTLILPYLEPLVSKTTLKEENGGVTVFPCLRNIGNGTAFKVCITAFKVCIKEATEETYDEVCVAAPFQNEYGNSFVERGNEIQAILRMSSFGGRVTLVVQFEDIEENVYEQRFGFSFDVNISNEISSADYTVTSPKLIKQKEIESK
mgnify:CR=1 FL=1